MAASPYDVVGCDTLTFSRRLRVLALKRTLCFHEASTLFEQFLLQLRHLFGVERVDESLDCVLVFRMRIREHVIHCLRYLGFATFCALPIEPCKFSDAHLSSEHVDVFAVVRLDLSRVAHARLLFSGPTTVYKL